MKAIWKYELDITDHQIFHMPKKAIPRYVGNQGDRLCLWMEVETANDPEKRFIGIAGTGHPIWDKPKNYVGSHVMDNGLVWHVFID